MNTLQKLSIAATGAAFLALEMMHGAQAVTLASASLGVTNPGDGFTVDSNQFLGWKFHLDSPFQVTAIGGNIQMGFGSIFGAIVALTSFNDLPQGNPFLPNQVLASTTFDSSNLYGDVRIPLSVTLLPGNYGLVYGSGLFSATGSTAMPYNNTDFPNSTYFICSSCASASGTWSNSQISNIRFVVEGDANTSIPNSAAVPEPSSILCILAFGGLVARYKNSLFSSRRSGYKSR